VDQLGAGLDARQVFDELAKGQLGGLFTEPRAGRGAKAEHRLEGLAGIHPIDELLDGREAEPTFLQLRDEAEALSMFGTVEGDASFASGRGEKAAGLVEADRRDGEVVVTSELLDGPLVGVGVVCSGHEHILSHKYLDSKYSNGLWSNHEAID
jgi:hypothetical protein